MPPCPSLLIHELRSATASTPETAVLERVEHLGEWQALSRGRVLLLKGTTL